MYSMTVSTTTTKPNATNEGPHLIAISDPMPNSVDSSATTSKTTTSNATTTHGKTSTSEN